MNIEKNLKSIKEDLPAEVTLVAVSKTKSTSMIMEAYNAGQRDFGENKVQEMTAKWEDLPKDIRWHMIGHVQRNKVKYMSDFVSLIHGVDSHRLLVEIDKRARNSERIIDCLLQVHIAEEESKFGFDEAEIIELLDSGKLESLKNVRLLGLMGMATFTEDSEQVRREFRGLKKLFDRLKERLPDFRELSMGMSGDYQIGIEEGSTMVRIGSSIFGARN